jgi:hypothetical protein
MRRLTPFASGIALAVAATFAAPRAAAPPTPVILELFTSEGCSSCPPADTLLQSLLEIQPVAGAEVIALGQHVDYWDELGWKDRFSSAALTERQRVYGRVLSLDSIYTPQVIVDGRSEAVGSDAAAIRRAIAHAVALPHATVSIAIERSTADKIAVSVSATNLPALSRRDHADIVVAVVENGLRSQVRAGENNGRTLTHAAVVRTLSVIGEATPAHAGALQQAQGEARTDLTLSPSWQRDQVRIVAFVQERASRHVLGAAAMALPGTPR